MDTLPPSASCLPTLPGLQALASKCPVSFVLNPIGLSLSLYLRSLSALPPGMWPQGPTPTPYGFVFSPPGDLWALKVFLMKKGETHGPTPSGWLLCPAEHG